MLVLSRKVAQEIVITTTDGKRIVISVLEIRGGKVRLGIEAPKEIIIMRNELNQAG